VACCAHTDLPRSHPAMHTYIHRHQYAPRPAAHPTYTAHAPSLPNCCVHSWHRTISRALTDGFTFVTTAKKSAAVRSGSRSFAVGTCFQVIGRPPSEGAQGVSHSLPSALICNVARRQREIYFYRTCPTWFLWLFGQKELDACMDWLSCCLLACLPACLPASLLACSPACLPCVPCLSCLLRVPFFGGVVVYTL